MRAFSLAFFVLVFAPLRCVADDKEAARDQALREADAKAWAANLEMYQKHVTPFLQKHCIACHGPKKLEGDLSLDLLDPNMKDTTSGARWAVVRDKIQSQEMPPEGNPRPADEESEPVIGWIRAEMKRARRNFSRRQQVIHGNQVPHELLFDPKHKVDLDAPARLRRHSSETYEAFRKEQAKGFENLVSNPFTPDPRFLFRDMGSPKLDTPTTSQLLRNALTIVERQTGFIQDNGILKPAPGAKKEFLRFVDPNQPLGEEEMAQAVRLQFQRTLGRSPSEDERQRLVNLMERNVAQAGRVAGVRYSLAAVYLLPEVVFRYEVGEIIGDNGDRARLSSRETAEALAYALTDKRPPSWLASLGQKDQLRDRQAVAEAVRRMWDDEKLEKPRILRFFHEYFEYHKAPEVFKDAEDFRYHKAKVLVSDTDNLVQWILKRDKQVLKQLLTTDHAFVNTRYDANKKQIVRFEAKGLVHLSYSLPPDWKWTDQQPLKMPNGTRAGVLTQPSWLTAWSMNQDNHAILRGKWVRERLLGNVVPDIPITVDAQLPDAPEKTLRERMEVTREDYCWQCHKLMNDVGLPFETYDHFGRWRARELGKPVDATGLIALTGDSIEMGVDGAVDFVHKLAAIERVEQVFVRHVFRYFAGRNENLGDGPSLREAQAAYRNNDGSFKELVVAILSSDSFLYRTR